MPFFMYLSGYVAWLSGVIDLPLEKWPRLVRSRAVRLLVPFVLFGATMLAAKLAAAPFTTVDNPPDGLLGGLRDMLWSTSRSPAIAIWYLYVLFVVSCLTPLLVHVAKGRLWLAALVALVLFALPIPMVAYLDRIAKFWIFFIVGILAAREGDRWLDAIDRYWWAALALLAALLVVLAAPRELKWSVLACGVVAIPALHGLVRCRPLSGSGLLLTLGGYSLVIYLLNTLAIGGAKAVMSRFLSWDGTGFLLFAPVLFAAGVLVPILVKRYVFRRVPFLDRITS